MFFDYKVVSFLMVVVSLVFVTMRKLDLRWFQETDFEKEDIEDHQETDSSNFIQETGSENFIQETVSENFIQETGSENLQE